MTEDHINIIGAWPAGLTAAIVLRKRELKPLMETSLVNRYLFEKFGHRGYRYIARRVAEGNPCDFLRRQYSPSLLKHLFLPAAMRNYKNKFKDRKTCAL